MTQPPPNSNESANTHPWLIVGLGNPGSRYSNHRHNVGQMVLDELARRLNTPFRQHKTNASVVEGRLAPHSPRLILLKPNCFMNISGDVVAAALSFYSQSIQQLIVIHDELDVPFDTLKLKKGGGHGGHNGVRDIIRATGENDFFRIRVGIGRPPGRQPVNDYVLHDFSAEQRAVLPNTIADAADAVELIVTDGLLAAQQRFHTQTVRDSK